MIARLTGFKGTIKFDANMPDGTMRKLLSVDLAKKCGWAPKIDLEEGIEQTIKWFSCNRSSIRE